MKRNVNMEAVGNAILYILCTSSCAWLMLPHDFPSGKTGYHYFR
ncbi:transposase [Anabaena sp. CS-542/02]